MFYIKKELKLSSTPLYTSLPKQFIQSFAQCLANGQAQPDCGIIVTLFNGGDGLPGDADQIRQLLLVQVLGDPGGL